jgi:hypothetical protein
MKKYIILISLGLFLGCSSNDTPETTKVTVKFTQSWENSTIGDSDFNNTFFTNAFGTNLSIVNLRYLISNIIVYKENGESYALKKYHLIDVTKNQSLSVISEIDVPVGEYKNVKMTFGFNNTDNIDGHYTDLNTVSWNVPGMLGGGYHFMQLEGRFVNNTQTQTNYQFHTIKAADISGATPKFTNTFFEKDLGAITVIPGSVIEIDMNIAEWFKSPNMWNLNTLHSLMMPNHAAQIMMFENGQNVFSLKSSTP